MELSSDEVAGVADLFGGLTRTELKEALAELAFKNGEGYDPDQFGGAIDRAIASYRLVSVEGVVEEPLLVPGPVAFPDQPSGSRDLPHILDVEPRAIDRDTAGDAAVSQFREEANEALEKDDGDRIERLLDVSYELEAWASVDVSETRNSLDAWL